MSESNKPEAPRSPTLARVIRRTLAGPTRFETWHVFALVNAATSNVPKPEIVIAESNEETDGQD